MLAEIWRSAVAQGSMEVSITQWFKTVSGEELLALQCTGCLRLRTSIAEVVSLLVDRRISATAERRTQKVETYANSPSSEGWRIPVKVRYGTTSGGFPISSLSSSRTAHVP